MKLNNVIFNIHTSNVRDGWLGGFFLSIWGCGAVVDTADLKSAVPQGTRRVRIPPSLHLI